jgi:hypothetical protein
MGRKVVSPRSHKYLVNDHMEFIPRMQE